jgi:hypothetical protein
MMIIIRMTGMKIDWEETNPATASAFPSAIRSLTMTKSLLFMGFLRFSGGTSGTLFFRKSLDKYSFMALMTALMMIELRLPTIEKVRRKE